MARFFDITKPGKGISKEDVENKKDIVLYLEIFFKRFWKLTLLNLIYLISSIPAIYICFKLSSFAVSNFAGHAGVPADESTLPYLVQITLFAALILLQLGGSGPSSAGMSYVLKKFADDTHAWVWSDFLRSFKQNFWQSLIIYVINTVAFSALTGSFIFYSFVIENSMTKVFRVAIVIVTVFFAMMQMYVYQLLAGFDLKIKEVYKNAAILVIVRLPQNVLAMVASIAVMYVIFNIVAANGMLNVMLMLLPVVMVFFFSLPSFTQIFMTRRIIRKYMINDNCKKDGDEEESVFSDNAAETKMTKD